MKDHYFTLTTMEPMGGQDAIVGQIDYAVGVQIRTAAVVGCRAGGIEPAGREDIQVDHVDFTVMVQVAGNKCHGDRTGFVQVGGVPGQAVRQGRQADSVEGAAYGIEVEDIPSRVRIRGNKAIGQFIILNKCASYK